MIGSLVRAEDPAYGRKEDSYGRRSTKDPRNDDLVDPSVGTSSPRYPLDIAIDDSGRWLFTANSARASVTSVDTKTSRVVGDFALPEGSFPRNVALSLVSKGESDAARFRVAVSLEHHHEIALLDIELGKEERFELLASRRVGVSRRPDDLLFTEVVDGSRLFLASRAEGVVEEIDVESGAIVGRHAAVEGARHLAWANDERTRLVVAGRSEIALLDLAQKKRLGTHALAAGRALNLGGLLVRDDRVFVAHPLKPTEVTIDPQMIVWGLVMSNRVSGIALADLAAPRALEQKTEEQKTRLVYGVEVPDSGVNEWIVPFDQRKRANGDPGRPALSASGRILVPSGGTDRLLLIPTRTEDTSDGSPWYETTDPLTREIALPSVNVGDRPVAVVTDPTGKLAYVLCSLDDRIDVVDVDARRVLRSLRLGPRPATTTEHLGARVFFDSKRSRDGWYSCHSCHPDGGSEGHRFDTHSDGEGLAKKAPALHGVTATGPWSWVGRFERLEDQLRSSMKKTMAVDHAPEEEDVRHVVSFLETLRSPQPTGENEDLGGDAARGRELFSSAKCETCHKGEHLTVEALKDVGVFDEYDGRREYNPPSLRGVRDRFRWLHDSRARTLEEVFAKHDPKSRHGEAKKLSPAEFRDLLAYLKTL